MVIVKHIFISDINNRKIVKSSGTVMYRYFFALYVTDIKSDKKENSK